MTRRACVHACLLAIFTLIPAAAQEAERPTKQDVPQTQQAVTPEAGGSGGADGNAAADGGRTGADGGRTGAATQPGVADGVAPATGRFAREIETPTRVVEETLHGVTIADPYRWLEDGDAAEVRSWSGAQTARTRETLHAFPEVRERLRARLEGLYALPTVATPRVFGERQFFTRRVGAQNHAVVYVRGAGDAARPVLNPNLFSRSGSIALDWWFPSPTGRYVAYGKSAAGDEWSTLYVRDITTGTDLPVRIPRTRSNTIAWRGDEAGFYYCRYPEPGRVAAGDENYFRHVFYHELGSDWREDPRCWGAGREKEAFPRVYSSSDYAFQFLVVQHGWNASDLYFKVDGEAEFRPIAVGLPANFAADGIDGKALILTDYQAPRGRILVVDPENPEPRHWKELIPQQTGVLESMHVIGGKLVVRMLENAYSRLMVYELTGEAATEIALPALGSVTGIAGSPTAAQVYYRFESFTYPPALFQYDLGTHESAELERMVVELTPDAYETKQVWFGSKDGTRVPMFVIHRAGLQLDGENPAVLTGYGGFNVSLTPRFLKDRLPFIDGGGVYAVVNLRGGGEFGREWHRAGQRETKQNVFDDFIAAAEKLIADKYTKPTRLGIWGERNGGLLVGAAMTQRRELFRAVLCVSPLLDMVRYHTYSIARLWIPEYGSAEDAEQFAYLYAYSPYHRVVDGAAYPAVLLQTGESDARVDPMHARKMAARLQAATESNQPVLLQVARHGGHGRGKPVSEEIDTYVDAWTFLMWQLGMIGRDVVAEQPSDPS